jgi:hypothetical protein
MELKLLQAIQYSVRPARLSLVCSVRLRIINKVAQIMHRCGYVNFVIPAIMFALRKKNCLKVKK